MPEDPKEDQKDQKTNTPAPAGASALAKPPEKKLLEVPEDENHLPAKPWSMNPNCKNNLIDRYGKAGAEVMYRRVALKYGHFDPLSESGYRPDLDEGDQIGELLEGK